jgi:aspartyl-tRNA synthetase
MIGLGILLDVTIKKVEVNMIENKKQKFAWKVDYPMSKWKVNSAHNPFSTPNIT